MCYSYISLSRCQWRKHYYEEQSLSAAHNLYLLYFLLLSISKSIVIKSLFFVVLFTTYIMQPKTSPFAFCTLNVAIIIAFSSLRINLVDSNTNLDWLKKPYCKSHRGISEIYTVYEYYLG